MLLSTYAIPFLLLQILISDAVACPQQDLHPSGIDPYVIMVGEKQLSLSINVHDGPLSNRPVVAEWRRILESCNNEQTMEWGYEI